eukprot:scaffold1411_cov221-Alexandrium_tamarense.AAC.5
MVLGTKRQMKNASRSSFGWSMDEDHIIQDTLRQDGPRALIRCPTIAPPALHHPLSDLTTTFVHHTVICRHPPALQSQTSSEEENE